ncbi:hypothetical protein D7319_10175 [Streptomyces radicis]|uniref:Uncharacterized protein n=2 Tax=Streptomyces radicis TaxID=1750517 RepID=A0A3A9WKY5_9ACTN|nr:hypothetical protein D7319_10175 [Streptomyces radicis]RKN24466.1 hypothetical protein D7318_11355 [Streptomyces radicis]
MSAEAFFAQLAGMEVEHLRKALWNLYRRGSAPVRGRVEAEIARVPAPRARATEKTPDSRRALDEVGAFTALA